MNGFIIILFILEKPLHLRKYAKIRENTRKFAKIRENTRKYAKIRENTRKYAKIRENTRACVLITKFFSRFSHFSISIIRLFRDLRFF